MAIDIIPLLYPNQQQFYPEVAPEAVTGLDSHLSVWATANGTLIYNTVKDLIGTVSGQPGADGKSAYELAVANGFSGTEAEWLASLKGPAGKDDATGATGPKGDTGIAGITPTDDSATLLDINTDKAHYFPSEKVTFHATSVSGHGHLVVKYYNLNNLITTKDVYYGTSELSWSWFLPSTDNVGYSVVINNYVGENNEANYRFAINVSSDPYNYPIMGFLSRYDMDYPLQRKEVLDYMKRLHINLVQFYDWADLHSLPLPVSSNGDSLQVSNTWTDIGNRLTRKKVIEDYCNLAKEYAMKPLAYMAMNGSDTNQLIHGLSAEMFLYDDNSKNLDHVYKTLDKSKGWGKYSLYSMNWMNGPWQDYIDNQMQIVRNNMPFEGWHIDMFGDPGNKYESDGNQISSATLAGGIHYFLDKAANLGWDTGVNSVGEYGINDIKTVTALKYLYTEVWDNRKTYDDMFRLVRGLKESTDSNKNKKGVIIPAYMNYDYAKNNSGKDFNIDGIILADLVIMASGGTHLEMGEHMLCNEYFPNSNLNLPTQLSSDYLPKIYDFFAAFKEIISLGYQVDGLAAIDNGSVDSLQNGNVCGISHGNDNNYLGLSLINLKTANTDWRDTNATCSVTPAENIKVTLKLGVTNHDWCYFDLAHLEPQKLNVGADGIVNIAKLHYFGFILGVPKSA
ncbi:glycoside hydrolase family 66 protein [Loigolactobacillus backii]|uniref:glycoside hydrolase family 66 protein n=1 Tax=Loigolactobacillus backii TaxID=375175 RepID=UPI0007F13452|nr:glycoside hydrolase family 66 protein [Loigolactobacillus backii]ANK60020.1 hypothetical protein AYR52_06935 [Loigolactobacillus backii]